MISNLKQEKIKKNGVGNDCGNAQKRRCNEHKERRAIRQCHYPFEDYIRVDFYHHEHNDHCYRIVPCSHQEIHRLNSFVCFFV